MTPVLEVDGVVKRFDRHLAVDHVSFSVAAGRIVGLLGPNGAGKTTTIRMILDILAPDEGEIRLFGRRGDESSRERVGYLPEERGLYRRMKVLEHLYFLAEIKGLGRREAGPRIDEWIDRLELREWAPRRVEELSKGMQQKVQFIAAVVHDPPILVLDEPFAGLDPINTSILKEFMTGARDRGTAIVFSTHVLEQAEKLCDDICLLSSGRKILDGPLTEVRKRYPLPDLEAIFIQAVRDGEA